MESSGGGPLQAAFNRVNVSSEAGGEKNRENLCKSVSHYVFKARLAALTMDPFELNEIKELLLPVFVKNKVKKVMVFGSLCRGSATKKSDLDLMIVIDTKKRFFDRYEQFEKIYEIFKGRDVDLLIYSPEELEGISHRPFIRQILNEGRIIYEC